MTEPTFFIAGAQKAGTTSLHAMLARHPEVFMPVLKEPGYFIRGFGDPESWQTLKRPYGGDVGNAPATFRQGIFTAEDYAQLYASEAALRARHRGDASTPYLPSRYAARRIAETCPDARIIMVLRDPVARAYSAWGYNKARGNESTASFEEAVEQELGGAREDWDCSWRYLHSGLYAQHVTRYLEHFQREQLLILEFEAFRTKANETFARICDFLDICCIPISVGTHENATVRHTNPILSQFREAFTTPSLVKNIVKPLIPNSARRNIKKRVFKTVDRFGERPPPLAADTEQWLATYFAEDSAKLQQLTGIDCGHWIPLAYPDHVPALDIRRT